MVALLKNVQISTSRAIYSVSTGTAAPTPYLSGIQGHIDKMTANDYRSAPVEALGTSFKLKVDPQVDIVAGDILTGITRLSNGSNWLGYVPSSNEVISVAIAENNAPDLLGSSGLECRIAYIKREEIGGPAR